MLFATTYDGKINISACNRNVLYRDKDGVHDWHFKRGIQELEDLRMLYGRNQKQPHNGVDKQYYPDGKIEIEGTYHHGLVNGIHTVYHRNGKVWGKQMFVNDSLRKTYSRIQGRLEALHDYNGKIIFSREYSRWGKIQHEYVHQPDENSFTSDLLARDESPTFYFFR